MGYSPPWQGRQDSGASARLTTGKQTDSISFTHKKQEKTRKKSLATKPQSLPSRDTHPLSRLHFLILAGDHVFKHRSLWGNVIVKPQQ